MAPTVNGLRVKDTSFATATACRSARLAQVLAGGNIEGAYHEEVQRLMSFDALTGVNNKRYFDETCASPCPPHKPAPSACSSSTSITSKK